LRGAIPPTGTINSLHLIMELSNQLEHYTVIMTGSFNSHPRKWFADTITDAMDSDELDKDDLNWQAIQTPPESSYLIMENKDWDKLNRILDAYKIMCETANLPASMAQEALDMENFIINHLESLND